MAVDCVLLFLTITFTCALCEANPGANSSDVGRVLNALFSNYNVLVRPAYNQSKPTVVNVIFNMKQLESLDIKTQTMKSLGYFSINWTDEFLTWHPEDYGGIKYITVPEIKIWKPDYVINNDVNGKKKMGDDSSLVVIEHNGQTLWEPGYVSTTTCQVNIKYFPFDEQICFIYLTSWMTSNISLLTETSSGVRLDYFFKNGEYIITPAHAAKTAYPMTYIQNEVLEGIAFSVTLTRRTTFYWLSLVSPLIVFPYLSPLSFLVPAESGEKTTLAITALLSVFVFMGAMYDHLPKLSNTVSYFGESLAQSKLCFTAFSMAILMSILTVRMDVIGVCADLYKFADRHIQRHHPEYSALVGCLQNTKGSGEQNQTEIFANKLYSDGR